MRHQTAIRWAVEIWILILTGLLLASCQPAIRCGDALGCIIIPAGKPILVGVEKAITGDEQIISQAVLEGLQYAKSLKPDLERHSIEFFLQDAPCSPLERVKTASFLTSVPDLAIVLGPICQDKANNFGKMISDAGVMLISPGPVSDFEPEPGWFSLYPSIDALAATIDKLNPPAGFSDYLIVQNRSADQQFAVQFCDIRKKNGHDCRIILNLDIGNYDLSDLSMISIPDSSTLFIIMPFTDASSLTGLPETHLNLNLIYFDPELGKKTDFHTLISNSTITITYALPIDAGILLAKLSPGSPDMAASIAFDTFNLVVQTIKNVGWVSADNSLVIPRQGLRDELAATTNFKGLAGRYACNTAHVCLDPRQFLSQKTSNH